MRSSGYTVIEVLVATFIFATAIAIATGSFIDSLSVLRRFSTEDESVFRLSEKIWLDNVFLCATDYFVRDEGDGRFYLYFDGRPDSIAFVTECPVKLHSPSLTYITKETGSNGTYNLQLYQMEVGTMNLRDIERAIIFSQIKNSRPYTVLKDVSMIEIKYLSYDKDRKEYIWKNEHRFRDYNTLPSAIAIKYRKDGADSQLFFRVLNTNSSKNIYNEFYDAR